MDELVAALEAIRGGESVPTVRSAAPAGPRRRNRLLIPGFIITVCIVIAMAGYWFLGRGEAIESIAVLPIIDHSATEGERGFADGFTGTLITELGKLEIVRLTGHRSVTKYRDSDKSLSEIAGELRC